MNLLWLSLGLFVIGLIEYTIDQYQKLLLSRLKLFSTLAFQLVNKLFEFGINLYVFGTIVIFWEKFQHGNHDFKLLLPYFMYTLGMVAGTGIAILIYAKLKKKRDRNKAIKSLEKARNKKKNMDKLKPDISTEVETLFDDMEQEDIKQQIKERAIEKASDIVAEQVEKAFKSEESNAREEDNRDSSQVQNESLKTEIPPSSSASST
jgi:hypothetical protein